MMLLQLGKYGDIINVLPLAFMLHKKLGERVKWVVGENWASVLDGVSYVQPMIYRWKDDQLHDAIQQFRGHPKVITQAWKNPDPNRLTDSFAKEQWRYANSLPEYGKWPLLFDKRDTAREWDLIDRTIGDARRPVVLVSTRSMSTPYRHAFRLLAVLKEKLDADVIDISSDFAHRIYDMIGLYDHADLLITVDTCHAHLARASYCPVIMLQNDGWNGAPPPPQTIASWRYSELGDNLNPVVEAAQNHLSRKTQSFALVCHTYPKGHEDRHRRAMSTHPEGTIYAVHEKRPTMKQLLTHGLNSHKDVVIFTNDDVSFPDGAIDKIMQHAQKFDFGCSRRPRTPIHVGREIFWFRDDFLRRYWELMPNPFWSVQKPDLIFARWLRSLKGIPTTLENLEYDFAPVEVPNIITHEDHPSHWANNVTECSSEGMYNEHLWNIGI